MNGLGGCRLARARSLAHRLLLTEFTFLCNRWDGRWRDTGPCFACSREDLIDGDPYIRASVREIQDIVGDDPDDEDTNGVVSSDVRKPCLDVWRGERVVVLVVVEVERIVFVFTEFACRTDNFKVQPHGRV